METSALWAACVWVGLLAYGLLGWAAVRGRHQPGLAAVLFLLPVWTLLGALFVVEWRSGSGAAMSNVERQTFPIALGGAYTETLAYYFTFAFAVVAGLALIPRESSEEVSQRRRLVVEVMDHFPIRGALLLCISVLAVEEILIRTLVSQIPGTSLYAADYNPTFDGSLTLKALKYLILAAGCLLVTCLTVALVQRARSIERVWSTVFVIAFALLTGLQVRVYLVMGERSETLSLGLALAIAITTYGTRTKRNFSARAAGFAASATLLYFTVVIGMTRVNSQSTREISSPLAHLTSPTTVWDYFIRDSLIGEAFPAHSSLYLLFERGVAPFQAVPFFSTSYDIYAEGVGLPMNAGFTIHPVAAWWLSVGPFAPLAAAAYLLALMLGLLWLGRLTVRPGTAAIVFVSSTWAFAVLAPVVLRSGPDGLRGVVTTTLVVPVLATWWLWFVAARRHAKADQSMIRRQRPRQPLRTGLAPLEAAVPESVRRARLTKGKAPHSSSR